MKNGTFLVPAIFGAILLTSCSAKKASLCTEGNGLWRVSEISTESAVTIEEARTLAARIGQAVNVDVACKHDVNEKDDETLADISVSSSHLNFSGSTWIHGNSFNFSSSYHFQYSKNPERFSVGLPSSVNEVLMRDAEYQALITERARLRAEKNEPTPAKDEN